MKAARLRQLAKNGELFGETSWIQVMIGQGIMPKAYHPFADRLSDAELVRYLEDLKSVIAKCVNVMPTHAQFVAAQCAA